MQRATFDVRAKRGDLTLLTYAVNRPGMAFLRVCAALLLLGVGGLYAWTGLTRAHWVAAAVMLAAGALYLLGLTVYWGRVARASLLAFDAESLFVVDAQRVTQIPWAALTHQSAGFGDSEQDAPTGKLSMHISGQPITLRLFNAFIWLDDYPTFLVELLTQLKRNRLAIADTDTNASAGAQQVGGDTPRTT
jgi:hypothetical protein